LVKTGDKDDKLMKKVYVDDTNQATIICPKCGFEKNVDVTNFKNTIKKLKAKCRCGEVFRLTLEFRKHPRKKVRLNGEYYVQGRDEKGEIIIEDITVELKFTLDNPMRTEIHKLVKIIWIIDRTVGVQYIDPKLLEKDLGYYLKT